MNAKFMYKWKVDENRTRELKGYTLWNAICESGYGGCHNPPIVRDWIIGQKEQYMEKDWDEDYLSRFMWDYEDYQILKIFEEQGYEPDKIGLDSEITRDTLEEIHKKIKPSAEEPNRKELFGEFKQKFKDYCENEREDSAFIRASEDFDLFIGDIDTTDDDQVEEFFGADFEKIGVVINGDEYALSEVWFCPNCSEPNLMENFTEEYYKETLDETFHEEYTSSKCYCEECAEICDAQCKGWQGVNKHLDEKEILSRLI